jgi:hypothetical protein
MAEPPGAQPALGIDAVEWLPTGDKTVTVIITGRWRRRASWRGRAMLVIEVQGHHHRFRAIPEPPSVAGATPGTWRMSFSIPAELAPHLGGQAWLRLGAVVVPLPGVVGPRAPEAEPSEPGVAEPKAQPPEILEAKAAPPAGEQPETPPEQQEPVRAGEEHARERAENVIAAVSQLSERIQHLESERRAAEQRANEEHARRLELEEQHADLHPQLAAAQSRVHELERQLSEARARPWRAQLSTEIAVARHAPRAVGHGHALDESAADRARAQLELEGEVIASAEADQSAALERELRDQALRAERLYEVIDELRAVIDAIRGVEVPGLPVEGVEPVRLDAALARLREEIPGPPEAVEVSSVPEAAASEAEVSPPVQEQPVAGPVAAPTRKSWLLRTLRKLAKDDPSAAGRIVLGLLPAERLVYAQDVAYDLVLSELGCVQVTARGAATQIWEAPGPRNALEVDFRLTGSLETFARFVLAGRLRRRSGRRMASFDGERKRLPALTSLVRTPLGLQELYAGGMRLDPALAFRLAASMIDPKAADGHRFTIGNRGPDQAWYLRIAGRERPVVTNAAPLGSVATTIVCEPALLLGVLAGVEQPGVVVRGAGEPLALLRDWILRAQSG